MMYLISVAMMKYVVITLIANFNQLKIVVHYFLDGFVGKQLILFVLFLFPLIMNIIQVLLTDVIFKFNQVHYYDIVDDDTGNSGLDV
jgi:hypothetical protein